MKQGRIHRIDLGNITIDEIAQLQTFCAADAADLEDLKTPQERIAYREGVLPADRLVRNVG